MTPAQGARYVVSIRMTGLGDRLICLAAAWLFARNTGRTLVIDWRFARLAPDCSTNGFPLSFQNSGYLAGVPIIADDRVSRLELPFPRFPFVWNKGPSLQDLLIRPANQMELDRKVFVELIRSQEDRPEPAVVFDSCINDGIYRFEDAREFYQSLEPIEPVAQAVEEFRGQRFGDRPVVGLHIRHGNGGDIMGHTRYWTSFPDAMERCRKCVASAREKLGQDAAVFLCTDSNEVEVAARTLIPGVLTRTKHFRPGGAGELHHQDRFWQARDDALVEMLLLSHAQALIRYPPGSFFSLYGAVMKPRTQVPPPSLYDLLRQADPEDPLSPALIL